MAQVASEGWLQNDLTPWALLPHGGNLLLVAIGQFPLDACDLFPRDHVVNAAEAIATDTERAGRNDILNAVDLEVSTVGAARNKLGRCQRSFISGPLPPEALRSDIPTAGAVRADVGARAWAMALEERILVAGALRPERHWVDKAAALLPSLPLSLHVRSVMGVLPVDGFRPCSILCARHHYHYLQL